MKLAIITLAVLAFAVAVFANEAKTSLDCTKLDQTGKTLYRDPNSSNKGWSGNYACMKYHDCNKGKDNVHHCFWLIPLLQFDQKTQRCTMFWKADCDAK